MIPSLRDWTHQDILHVTQVVEVHWLPWNHLWKNKEEEKLSISLCWITNPSLGWFSRENRHATHAEDELLDPIITGGMEASKKREKLLQIINISSHLQDTPFSRQATAVIHATSHIAACPYHLNSVRAYFLLTCEFPASPDGEDVTHLWGGWWTRVSGGKRFWWVSGWETWIFSSVSAICQGNWKQEGSAGKHCHGS